MQKRTVLITGAGRGIGRATARRLRDQASLILLTKTDESQKSLKEEFPEAFCFAVDLTNTRNIESVIKTVKGLTQSIDVLINNAGTYASALFEETSVEQLDNQYAIHLRAPFLLTRELLPLLRKGSNPIVINISSAAAFARSPREAVYSAAKAGLTTLTDIIREELQKDGIRFTVVQPYGVNTWNDAHPENYLRSEDIADLVDFVINSHPNCQILTVDVSSVKQWRKGVPPWLQSRT